MKHMFSALALGAALILVTPAVAQQQPGKKQSESAATEKGQFKDPVCGMMLDAKTAAAKSEYKGKTYYFCNVDEKKEFDAAPQKYVKETTSKSKKTS